MRCVGGDPAMRQPELASAFLKERPMILRMLAARLGNAEDAEDAAQELWLKLDDVSADTIANPAAYLFRMAANLASDRRSSAMAGTARDLAWLELQPGAAELPDAERVLLARERLKNVDAVLKSMPERMSTAFRMFRIEGHSQKAIAETIGISVSGVEKLLQRAYRQVYDAGMFFGEDSVPPHRLGSMKETES